MINRMLDPLTRIARHSAGLAELPGVIAADWDYDQAAGTVVGVLTFAAAAPGLDATLERLGPAVAAREGWRWRGLASDDASLGVT